MEKIRVNSPAKAEVNKSMCVTLTQLAECIKNDKVTKMVCDKLRTNTDGWSHQEKQNVKWNYLCGFEPHSVCEGNRDANNVSRLTGLVVLDYDDFGGDYQILKDNIIANDKINPCIAFFSPNGKLKVGMRIKELEDAVGTPSELKDLFNFYYKQVMIYVYKTIPVKPDVACCDVVRLCYMSSDEQCYFDEDAYCGFLFRDYTQEQVAVVNDEYDELFKERKFKQNHNQREYAQFEESDLNGLQGVMTDFAKLCLEKQFSVLDDYNEWIAFGSCLRFIFNNKKNACAVWDACSCYSHSYQQGCCKQKYDLLPVSSYVGIIGQICNLFRYNYPELSKKYNIQVWLNYEMKKYGLLR